MFHENNIEINASTEDRVDVWVRYFGTSLHIELKTKHIVDNKVFVATDKDGMVFVGARAPTILENDPIWTGYNGFCNLIGNTGSELPVCWKDSLVEYKL